MGDPRFDGSHLDPDRYNLYQATVASLLDARGPVTADFDLSVPPPSGVRRSFRRAYPLPGGAYTLVSLTDGRRHSLRMGINTVGRAESNDLVLASNDVSRRHCVVLVHAGGGCEVYDTASLHGTRVNRRQVMRVELLPGDVLELSSQRFLVEWLGTDGAQLPVVAAPETFVAQRMAPADEVPA